MTGAYVACDTKRPRRTKAEMARLREAIFEIVAENRPMTCRQAFYACVVAGLIDKTDTEYNRTVVRLLSEMRRADKLLAAEASERQILAALPVRRGGAA